MPDNSIQLLRLPFRWLARALAGLALASCSGPASGLAITVHFAASSQSQCAIVGVRKPGGSISFQVVPRHGKSSIIIGVERASTLRGRVFPYAQGFVAADCTGGIAEGSSPSTAVDLEAPGLQSMSLTLEGPPDDGGYGGGGGAGGSGGSGGGGGVGAGGGPAGGAGGSGGGGSAGGVGGAGGGSTAPTVTSTTPVNSATNASTGEKPTATFSTAMDPATLTTLTFTLVHGSTNRPGVVTYAGATHTATFTPSAPLGDNLAYQATITTGAQDVGALPLALAHSWTFTTAPIVELRTVQTYSVLGTTVTNTGPTTLDGDLGTSSDAGSEGTGPITVGGVTHAGDPQFAQARADLRLAYDDVATRTSTSTDIIATGQTLDAGVYNTGGALTMTKLTLDGEGNPNAVFIFQIGGALTINSPGVDLINRAQASHVFWQVNGAVTLNATCMGTIIGSAAITVADGVPVEGRVLTLGSSAAGVVTLSTNAIVMPAQ